LRKPAENQNPDTLRRIAMSLTIGQSLQDRYRIDALLAQGTTGATYRAYDETLDRAVVIKETEETSEAPEQFHHQAERLRELRHANLPRVTDHFRIAGQGHYLAEDHIEGDDLNQILRQQGVVPEDQALAWIDQVLEALEYLHGQNIIHQDLKPSNIRIDPEGKVFVVDIGLPQAEDLGQEAPAVPPVFSSPEQHVQEHTDARSNVYSIGALLYALLTGQAPPNAGDRAAGEAQLVPPRQLNPEISVQVAEAILRAMQTSPADRFESAAELRAALAEVEPVGAPPGTADAPPSAEAERSRLRSLFAGRSAGLWAVGALLVALILVLIVWQPFTPGSSPTASEATATISLTAEEHFRRGNELIQEGDLEAAAVEYQKALEMDPQYVDALTNLGVVYYNLEQLDAAAEQYSKAIEIAPNDADIRSNLAAAYVQMNQLDRALEEYLKAVELNPELAEAYFGLGVVYTQLGETDNGIEAFERFQELDTGRDPRASQQAEQWLEQLRGQ
jgi:serine/threonine-protein kinase